MSLVKKNSAAYTGLLSSYHRHCGKKRWKGEGYSLPVEDLFPAKSL